MYVLFEGKAFPKDLVLSHANRHCEVNLSPGKILGKHY